MMHGCIVCYSRGSSHGNWKPEAKGGRELDRSAHLDESLVVLGTCIYLFDYLTIKNLILLLHRL